jgi:hypothetical protein
MILKKKWKIKSAVLKDMLAGDSTLHDAEDMELEGELFRLFPEHLGTRRPIF